MDFGRIPSVDDVDFTLPPDPAGQADRLRRDGPARKLDVRIGMPLWAHAGLAARLGAGDAGEAPRRATAPPDALRVHAAAMPSTELNSTFYGSTRERLEAWAARAPRDFLFCPKLPGRITHELGLVDADSAMGDFVAQTEALGPRRGLTWFALPPYLAPDRFPDLAGFLRRWAPRLPLGVELREERWFSMRRGFDELCDLLGELGVSLVLADTAGRRDCAHMRLTTRTTIIRFVGNSLHPTDFPRLDAWAERLAAWGELGLERAYVFLHQPDEAQTVDLADHLEAALERNGIPSLGPWRARTGYRPPGSQMSLF